jgi:hypothetical protein
MVIDLDLDRPALDQARVDLAALRRLRRSLEGALAHWVKTLGELGLTPIVEDTGGRGRHLWILLEDPVDAALAYELGSLLLATAGPVDFNEVSAEFFPKQPRLGPRRRYGSLVRLPLGIHRVTGNRSHFLDAKGGPCEDPWALLRKAPRISESSFLGALDQLRRRAGAAKTTGPSATSQGPFLGEDAGEGFPWTRGHLRTDPEVQHLRGRCAPLEHIISRADVGELVAWDEWLILLHVLGHLPQGPRALAALTGTEDLARKLGLGRPLSGAPMSCAKVRTRHRSVGSNACSDCNFGQLDGAYPSPVLHLRDLDPRIGLAPRDREPGSLERAVRAYVKLERDGSARGIQDREYLGQRLAEFLKTAPDRSVRVRDGLLILKEQQGIEALVWQAGNEPDDQPNLLGEGA